MVNHEKFRKVVARHAVAIEGSGMSEPDAMRIFRESSVESIAVVRDWYLLYIPFDEDGDRPGSSGAVKPFRLTALEVLADKKERFGSGRLVTGYVRNFLGNHTFMTTNSTYLLVGEGSIVANHEELSWDLLSSSQDE